MTDLEAVNQVLASVGESPVNTTATAHPEVVAIMAVLKSENIRRQARGWWFNKYVTNHPGGALPAGTSYARPLKRSLSYFARGTELRDAKTGLVVSGAVPELEIQTVVPFSSLPDEFANYVTAAAAVSYAIEFDADEVHLAAARLQLEAAEVMVHRLHIRYYEIDKASKRLQARGWWFNKSRKTLTPTLGVVLVPDSYLFVKPVMKSLDYFPKDGQLIDRNTSLPVTSSVLCDVVEYVEDYDSLPQVFQDYVSAVAELERAQDFLPSSSSIPRLQSNMELARVNANNEHVKYAAVNLFGTASTGTSINRAWGSRYRV